MKKVFIVLALVLVMIVPLSAASYMKTNGVGVGVSGGYPFSGAAFKYGMDDFRIVGTLGYNYGGGISVEVGAQYDVYQFDIGELPFYVNVGVTGSASFIFDDLKNIGVAANVPVGLSYFFEQFPMEVFLNVAPGVKILLSIGFDIGGALGALWYFD